MINNERVFIIDWHVKGVDWVVGTIYIPFVTLVDGLSIIKLRYMVIALAFGWIHLRAVIVLQFLLYHSLHPRVVCSGLKGIMCWLHISRVELHKLERTDPVVINPVTVK